MPAENIQYGLVVVGSIRYENGVIENLKTRIPKPPSLPIMGKALPIETTFNLPLPLPSWQPGSGFGSRSIDLGGLEVCRVSTFKRVWAAYEGGPGNLGATFFEPMAIPQGFFMLGGYCQPNNRPLNGWVLVAKDGAALAKPTDYTLVWSSESLKMKQDSHGHFWLPVPPDGYIAVGLVVTASPEKPSVDSIRCVRSDFTEPSQAETSIWVSPNNATESLKVSSSRPQSRGTRALGVAVGTYIAEVNSSVNPLRCLKNNSSSYTSYMPSRSQIDALIRTYSPLFYFHPKEKYLPSSVRWFFSNGALLYKKGNESNPVPIEPTGSNLPQDGSNDGLYWLDLPVTKVGKGKVKKGDLQSSEGYLHVKPMYGGTFTDIAIWLFYPFNGPSRAKLWVVNVPLGRIGEHVGDWEHVTLRVNNFDGGLYKVFFSQHSGGTWVDASELEYQACGGGESNRFVAYSSLNGHATYSKPGLVLQGSRKIGIRNDTAKSCLTVDVAASFSLVAIDYAAAGGSVAPPPWLNYMRKWGPKITYNIAEKVEKVGNVLPRKLKSAFHGLVKSLPSELFGEEGPTGPKVKTNWSGDEASC
ncbi:hypothetical protein SAY86_011249 [Trapa natans]|uniref:Vacuolar protein sorting-associated protein 62 n=1 Tax=Trapa natans TaxID=22666 RepID=A0AAN7LYH0_TRANT|nr:hypothetical protein SAY86_011249 [Trapa natans]